MAWHGMAWHGIAHIIITSANTTATVIAVAAAVMVIAHSSVRIHVNGDVSKKRT